MKIAYKRSCLHCGKMFGGKGVRLNIKFCSRKCYWDSGFHSNFMKTHPNKTQFKKGIKFPKEWTDKWSKNRKGKIPKNFELVQKLSPLNKKGHPSYLTEESKRKISIGNKGKPKSSEHIKKVNESNKIYWDIKGRKKQDRSHHNIDKKYLEWRTGVFVRDKYICQKCGTKGGNGIFIQAHHIKQWVSYPELRYDLNNGITLCVECHKFFHKFRRNTDGSAILQKERECNSKREGNTLLLPTNMEK
jgi:5-methylcytosine-specific restriction endonuclease McrA